MAKKKKAQTLNSTILKAEAMCFLRYTKRVFLICTEAGCSSWPADVLGIAPNYSIEIEVKITKADLLKDFDSKSAKHAAYKAASLNPKASSVDWVPTYFYFLVPEELREAAIEVVLKEQPSAGVLTYSPRPYFQQDGKKLICVKQAQKLHLHKPSNKLKKAAIMRMGSELCRNKLVFANDGKEPTEMPIGIIDPVDPQRELEKRAAILGRALHGKQWENATPGEKNQLISMVQKLADAWLDECIYEESK